MDQSWELVADEISLNGEARQRIFPYASGMFQFSIFPSLAFQSMMIENQDF